jgi:hypothetical protein
MARPFTSNKKRNNPLRAKQNRASAHGGRKIQRGSGGGRRVLNKHDRVKCTPGIYGDDGGRFSDDPPTLEQQAEWDRLVSTYARRLMARRHPELSVSVLSAAMGISERSATVIIREGRGDRDPADTLTEDILYGMRDGKIAGVLGVRHSAEAGLIFRLVLDTDPSKVRIAQDEFRRLHSIFNLEYLAWKRGLK